MIEEKKKNKQKVEPSPLNILKQQQHQSERCIFYEKKKLNIYKFVTSQEKSSFFYVIIFLVFLYILQREA
jgi:hypothetical protein